MKWALLLAAGLILSASLQTWMDGERRASGFTDESLYLTSGETLKKASIGFDGLLADLYWIRTNLYFGERLEEQRASRSSLDLRQMRLLQPMLEITTELDPHHIAAYRFGAFFLPYIEPAKAIEFVESGIRNNPGEWRLYQDLGFIYWNGQRYREAGETYLRGSRIPGTPPWMSVMAASMIQRGGDPETARQLFAQLCQNTDDQFIKQICEQQASSSSP